MARFSEIVKTMTHPCEELHVGRSQSLQERSLTRITGQSNTDILATMVQSSFGSSDTHKHNTSLTRHYGRCTRFPPLAISGAQETTSIRFIRPHLSHSAQHHQSYTEPMVIFSFLRRVATFVKNSISRLDANCSKGRSTHYLTVTPTSYYFSASKPATRIALWFQSISTWQVGALVFSGVAWTKNILWSALVDNLIRDFRVSESALLLP
jgi:hypothetical protein